MAEIPLIPQQVFEAIHNRIGEILTEELEKQSILASDPTLIFPIFKERDIPFNDSELPAMNVMFDESEYDMQTQVQHTGDYQYVIELAANGKSNDEKFGDTLTMNQVQRVLGICREIIMNPKFTTLGFPKPLIENRKVIGMRFGKPVRQDSSHTILGRMMIRVKAVESAQLNTADLIQGIDTTVFLYETENGYQWKSYFMQ